MQDGRATARAGDGERSPAHARRVSPQARLEQHPLGRALISGFLVVVLGAMVVSNLPSSELKEEVQPVFDPVLDATALTQNWNLFAPDPRNSTLRLAARMTYADGVVLEWHQPESDPFVGPYRLYRWRKLANNLVSDRRTQLWPDVAAWLARTHERAGAPPVEVVLLRQFYFAPEPGSGDDHRPPWREDVLHRSVRPAEGE